MTSIHGTLIILNIRMNNYTEEEIKSLIDRFEIHQLPKVEWTHEAHLVVAIWYCSNYSPKQALELVRRKITEHNVAVGTLNSDTDGYHETITAFWLLVADAFIKKQPEISMAALCNRFINSEQGQSSYPLQYYSEERLFSIEARHTWIEPDLKTLI